jgi:hypothetical protein
MRSPSCLCVCVSPSNNFWMPEPVFMKHGMYFMATEPISTAYFLNPPISLCVGMFIPPIVARQRLGKHVPAAKDTRNSRRIGHVIFYAVRVLPKETLWVCLCIPLSLLGNKSVKTFPRERWISGGVVFYTVRVVSKERRRSVLPKTSCNMYVCSLTEHFYKDKPIQIVNFFSFCFRPCDLIEDPRKQPGALRKFSWRASPILVSIDSWCQQGGCERLRESSVYDISFVSCYVP